MTRLTASSRRRKLNTRQALPVLREGTEDFDINDLNLPKIETGVEKAEEKEHHLRAAIDDTPEGKPVIVNIPTPVTVQSAVQYDRLYPPKFSQPATYIRFSSTVEDCIGCPYNLTDEDNAYLKHLNEKRDASTHCTEDQFEVVMNFFEETACSRQPFAAVDNPPVVPWEEIENESLDEENAPDNNARIFAREIYEHWRTRRLKNGNQPLIPGLKFGTGTDTEDGDPYVCFRRREVRQVRKTRGRDAQSVEKLRKLRRELEDARQLIALIRRREITKREQLLVDRQLFDKRTALRQLKKNLPDQFKEGDDDLLINQKPQKKKPLEIATSQRTPAMGLRPGPRDGRSLEDLQSLSDVLAEKENEIEREINIKKAQHEKWNEGYVDLTRAPLTPPLDDNQYPGFRKAVPQYLPTPPASVSEHSGEQNGDTPSPPRKINAIDAIAVRYEAPCFNESLGMQPSFRRRIGRGGRMMIDRRGMNLQSMEGIDPVVLDRFKYDRDDDEDDESPTYLIDPYDISSMRYRAAIAGNSQQHPQAQAARRAQIEAAGSTSQVSPPTLSSSAAARNASSS